MDRPRVPATAAASAPISGDRLLGDVALDRPAASRRRPSLRRRRLVIAGLIILLACLAYAAGRIAQAALAARAGKADLQRAAAELRAQHVNAARAAFTAAGRHFAAAQDD